MRKHIPFLQVLSVNHFNMKIFGVYNARSGLVGEASYLLGKLLGTTHCSFCDITHSIFTKKKEWNNFIQDFEIPILAIHINEQNDDMKKITLGRTPCIVLQEEEDYFLLMDEHSLTECIGEVKRFKEKLHEAMNNYKQSSKNI